MNNKIINSIGIIALVSVITVPLAYSVTESSIVIPMEVGQTEKPIQVKDNLGNEIFSIDTDGTQFPDPTFTLPPSLETLDDRLVMLTYTQSTEHQEVFVGANDNDSAVPVAKWRVDYDNTNVECDGCEGGGGYVFVVSACWTGYMKTSSPDVGIRLIQSDDDIDYSTGLKAEMDTQSLTYEATDGCATSEGTEQLCELMRNNGGADTACYIKLGLHTNGAGTMFYKGVQIDYIVILPDGATITQVI